MTKIGFQDVFAKSKDYLDQMLDNNKYYLIFLKAQLKTLYLLIDGNSDNNVYQTNVLQIKELILTEESLKNKLLCQLQALNLSNRESSS